MSVARELAEFLVEARQSELPPQTMQHAAMLVASTIASAACGTRIQSAQIVRDLVREQGGRSDASLWFALGPKLPMAEAARANAMLSDAAASDDSDLRNIVHAGTPLTATSLALAERIGASGKEVLTAMVLGYEAAGRIGEQVTPGIRTRGFHGCLGAIFAATVAAAHLLSLDASRMAQSIALAATSIGGLSTAADTSCSREYHAGLATLLGINAALAAERGYIGEERILETPRGFFEAFGGADGASAGLAATRGLGESWDIVTDMAVKLVPGGHPNHAFAEAAANAARDGHIRASDVACITISRPGLISLGEPLHPVDLIGMAHSLAYFVAAGVADREFTWAHASPDKITDPTIHELIDKVTVGPQPTSNVPLYRQGGSVTIRTYDGRTFTSTVYLPKGSGALGIDWSEIDAKYRTLLPTSGLAPDRIEASLRAIHNLQALPNVSPLVDLLRPG